MADDKQTSLTKRGSKPPFSKELRTPQLLDILIELLPQYRTEGQSKEEYRSVFQQRLSYRSKPGTQIPISDQLHIEYVGQPDGFKSHHLWRLYYGREHKEVVEKTVSGSSLVSRQAETDSRSEWGGMFFRSEAERRIAEALYKEGVLFFVNCLGRVGDRGSPISGKQSNGRLEVDFLVFVRGKAMILEVDGQHHKEGGQTVRDYVRDRLMLREGIPTARFTGKECLDAPGQVVQEFLNLFGQ